MSKAKRKTRKQKITADLHRQLYSLKSQEPLIYQKEKSEEAPKVNPAVQIMQNKIPQTATATVNYPFLIRDITKTGILTIAIAIAQLFIFFLFKIHILKLPGIIY